MGAKPKNMQKIRVALLAGGWSREREVSMASGDAVYEAFDRDKYAVERIDPARNLRTLVGSPDNFDVVFSVLHGKRGEDGCMQGLVEILGIPMVGSGVLGSAVSMNKQISKDVYCRAGLKVAPYSVLSKDRPVHVGELIEKLGLPLVVKPVEEGSSIGMSLCRDEKEVLKGIELAFEHGEEIMAEVFLDGREITCCVIGGRSLETLPLIEIVSRSGAGFFDYAAKYSPGGASEICPAALPDSTAERLCLAAKTAHRALHCGVWSRTDMILQGDDFFVLETNTLPGMTQRSLFPLAARAAGLNLSDLLDRLVRIALESADARELLAAQHR
ncbi:D-alanine--D-alanine ligase [uncultured Desulfatiglans sp.]|uniref:D-alanine--D-alanine ligase n=1 Tax=Uncultured Desulfatiglans sp. TaxID=1748965 RepID=A0A653AIJ5_UNCDX|nr:D-alanine--D-alanine ligase [uncultured Desulfatiglans sp.]